RAGSRRQDQRAQRTLCRNARAARRLLPDRGARSRRGQRMGRALPECGVGHARSSSGLGDVMAGGDALAREAAENAARRSYGKLVAFLAARTRDVAGAEDALSEAFTAALADWPASGVPANPEGWLMSVARRKSIDALRRTRRGEGAGDHLRLLAEELGSAAADQSGFPDHRLALMFVCAHPAIDPRIRAPLILQTILGLDAAAIASTF